MMKAIKLTTKISIVSVSFIVIFTVLLGIYFDKFLRDNYFNNAKAKINYAKDRVIADFKATQEELRTGIGFIKTDNDLIASIELINNYQNKDNYNAILLDEEKKDIADVLLEKVKISLNSTIKLYDKNEELIAYVYKDKDRYKLNFISYENSKKFLHTKYEDEKNYQRIDYIESSESPFKHTNYYSQPALKDSVLITSHISDNTLHFDSHQSIFLNDDESKTILHLEMSKIYSELYFHKISNDLDLNIFIDKDKFYEKDATEPLCDAKLENIDIKEHEGDYYSAFLLNTKNTKLPLVFSLDKQQLNYTLNENRKRLALFLFISIILILIVFNYLLHFGISIPLDKLMEQISKIKSGNYSETTVVKTADELEEISKNMNMLSDAVSSREQALKDSQKDLEYYSTHDELTGLLNRRSFSIKLDYALKVAKRNSKKLAVLFLDLDQFKQINDTLGHSIGDNLLKQVASRLRESLRDSDILSRVGGDEFNIFVEGFKNTRELQTFAKKILDDFEEPFVDTKNELMTSVSIGIAVFPEDGLNSETLIKNADLAMYSAKETGRNSYSFYSSALSKLLNDRMSIVNALKWSIKTQNEFVLYYQPKISTKTQKIIAVEALIRWNSSELGFVTPDRFIEIAEETHMIIDIGKWVINQACKDFVKLKESGFKLEQVSVNVSSIQLQYSDMLKTIKEVIDSTNIQASELELEITESYIATNEDSAIDTLSEFRDMGIGIAIDDFGTGYSSLSYLQKLPISRLKIDKAFIGDLENSLESIAVVKAILALGEAFYLNITVEGVETQKQVDFFSNKNCEEIQGYFYSKPLPINELKKFIKHSQ